jgi:hypothetical protein
MTDHLSDETRRLRPERQPTFMVRLRPGKGVDAVRNLRLALKFLARRFGLRAIDVREERSAP